MSKFIPNAMEALKDHFVPESICLPQHDKDSKGRQFELANMRQKYEFGYTQVSPLAICNSVPIRDQFGFQWLGIVAERVLTALSNRAELEVGVKLRDVHQSKHRLLSSLRSGGIAKVAEIRNVVREALKLDGRLGSPVRHAKTLSEYAELFRNIGLPPIAKDFHEDSAFAEMRVGGPNPVMLRRMTAKDERLPITDALFQVGAPGDTLQAAMQEARLYLADYAILDGAEPGAFPNGQKYLAAPLALFVVDKKSKQLMPVAIQCQQLPGPANPIFTPKDGWNWMIAKTFVEIADGNIHEASTHLGRTHLSMEPFVVSSLRQLADNHPLSLLLRPHFEGTLAINEASWQHLIADKGGVEKLFSASIKAARGLAVNGVQSLKVMDSLLPKTFAERGVDDASALPHYPYRDDALLYWDTIQKWVTSYTRLYYAADADVEADTELQAWVRELSTREGGRINGLPNGGNAIKRIDELTDVLTFVIYTCSVQHAAVNFPQYDYMSYTPNMPLAAYRPAPTTKTGATEADFLATLPTLDMAELQMDLGYLLGTVHYTELGAYEKNQFEKDPRVASHLQSFQKSLSQVGEVLEERNAKRSRPYTTLAPTGIPQSINI